MAVLVTRPLPDGETTAADLARAGLRGHHRADAAVRAVRLSRRRGCRLWRASSSPAPTRCARSNLQLAGSTLLKLPLFAVGERTAAAARAAGFTDVVAGEGDAAALRDLVVENAKAKKLKKAIAAALSRRRGTGARSCRRTRATRALRSSPRSPTGWFPPRTCRARWSMALPPGGSRRCCIIPAAAPAPLSMRRGQAGWKYRRFRCRNAAFRRPWRTLSAKPAQPR